MIVHPTGEPKPYTDPCNNPYFDWIMPAETTRITDAMLSKKRDTVNGVEAV